MVNKKLSDYSTTLIKKITDCKKTAMRYKASLLISLSIISLVVFAIPFKLSNGVNPISGLVECEDDLCSEIGNKAFIDGGNAMDAVITTALCMSALNQQSTSFAGDGFVLIHSEKTGKSTGLSFKSTLPNKVDINGLFETCKAETNTIGVFSSNKEPNGNNVGVPTLLRGLDKASSIYSTQNIAKSFRRVIDYFESQKGVFQFRPRNMKVRKAISKKVQESLYKGFNYTSISEFHHNDKSMMTQMISFLKNIEKNGINEAVYSRKSKFAKELVGMTKISFDELESYQPEIIKDGLIKFNFFDSQIITLPQPSGGLSLRLTLETFEKVYKELSDRFNLRNADLFALIQKEVYQAGYKLNKDNFSQMSNQITEKIKIVIKNLLNDVSNENHNSVKESKTYKPYQGGTTHISAADSNGLYISATLSVNRGFGTGLVLPSSQVVLNDGNCDVIDFIDPATFQEEDNDGKILIKSSMTPTIIISNKEKGNSNSKVYCSIGSKGSQKIHQGIAQTISNIIHKKLSIREAANQDRVYAIGNTILYEHEITPFSTNIGDFAEIKHADVKNNPVIGICSIDGNFERLNDSRCVQ